MAQTRETIRRRLCVALREADPVRVRREGLDVDETKGLVVAVLDEWVALHDFLIGPHLDSLQLIRLAEVTSVGRFAKKEREYIRRAVEGLGVEVATFDCPPDAGAAELLRALGDRGEIVGVHLEAPDGDWINFGKVLRIGRRRLDLQYVGRDGDWVEYVDRWRLDEITRIEAGGVYEKALARFSDPRPEPTEPPRKR